MVSRTAEWQSWCVRVKTSKLNCPHRQDRHWPVRQSCKLACSTNECWEVQDCIATEYCLMWSSVVHKAKPQCPFNWAASVVDIRRDAWQF